jgi:hypothetical protein
MRSTSLTVLRPFTLMTSVAQQQRAVKGPPETAHTLAERIFILLLHVTWCERLVLLR